MARNPSIEKRLQTADNLTESLAADQEPLDTSTIVIGFEPRRTIQNELTQGTELERPEFVWATNHPKGITYLSEERGIIGLGASMEDPKGEAACIPNRENLPEGNKSIVIVLDLPEGRLVACFRPALANYHPVQDYLAIALSKREIQVPTPTGQTRPETRTTIGIASNDGVSQTPVTKEELEEDQRLVPTERLPDGRFDAISHSEDHAKAAGEAALVAVTGVGTKNAAKHAIKACQEVGRPGATTVQLVTIELPEGGSLMEVEATALGGNGNLSPDGILVFTETGKVPFSIPYQPPATGTEDGLHAGSYPLPKGFDERMLVNTTGTADKPGQDPRFDSRGFYVPDYREQYPSVQPDGTLTPLYTEIWEPYIVMVNSDGAILNRENAPNMIGRLLGDPAEVIKVAQTEAFQNAMLLLENPRNGNLHPTKGEPVPDDGHWVMFIPRAQLDEEQRDFGQVKAAYPEAQPKPEFPRPLRKAILEARASTQALVFRLPLVQRRVEAEAEEAEGMTPEAAAKLYQEALLRHVGLADAISAVLPNSEEEVGEVTRYRNNTRALELLELSTRPLQGLTSVDIKMPANDYLELLARNLQFLLNPESEEVPTAIQRLTEEQRLLRATFVGDLIDFIQTPRRIGGNVGKKTTVKAVLQQYQAQSITTYTELLQSLADHRHLENCSEGQIRLLETVQTLNMLVSESPDLTDEASLGKTEEVIVSSQRATESKIGDRLPALLEATAPERPEALSTTLATVQGRIGEVTIALGALQRAIALAEAEAEDTPSEVLYADIQTQLHLNAEALGEKPTVEYQAAVARKQAQEQLQAIREQNGPAYTASLKLLYGLFDPEVQVELTNEDVASLGSLEDPFTIVRLMARKVLWDRAETSFKIPTFSKAAAIVKGVSSLIGQLKDVPDLQEQVTELIQTLLLTVTAQRIGVKVSVDEIQQEHIGEDVTDPVEALAEKYSSIGSANSALLRRADELGIVPQEDAESD